MYLADDIESFILSQIFGGSLPKIYGTGADGAFNSSASVNWVPDGSGYIIKNFTDCTINSGHIIGASAQAKAMIILCTGNCTINGTIDMNYRAWTDTSFEHIHALSFKQVIAGSFVPPTKSLPVGGAGGAGGPGDGSPTYPSPGGLAGAGGIGTVFGGGGGGGGGGGQGYSNTGTPSVAGSGGTGTRTSGTGGSGGVVNAPSEADQGRHADGASGGPGAGGGGGAHIRAHYLVRNGYAGSGGNASGGASGGGGGGVAWDYYGSSGSVSAGSGSTGSGGGGGVIIIVCKGTLTIGSTGIVRANGGNGGNGGNGAVGPGDGGSSAAGGGGGGGGSGGGVIMLFYYGAYSNAGIVQVNGGAGGIKGTGAGGQLSYWLTRVGTNGQAGSVGTIFVEKISN